MFELFNRKKKEIPLDVSLLKTDMHSHLLPGIDDGAKDLDTAIQMISGLKEAGYQKLITTPHILWDIYKNTPGIIQSKLDAVRNELVKRNIDIELHAAGEYFLDDYVAGLLQKKEPLLTVKDNMVLVEFSVMHMSINMKEILFDVQMAGYQPILAHPERYTYLNNHKDIFEELRDNGCYFQLNILSLSGGYGRTVTDMATYFLKNNFYSFIGTDMHHTGHLERLKNLQSSPELATLLNSGQLLNNQL